MSFADLLCNVGDHETLLHTELSKVQTINQVTSEEVLTKVKDALLSLSSISIGDRLSLMANISSNLDNIFAHADGTDESDEDEKVKV